MTDDLGKRITQVPGFEWKRGMHARIDGDSTGLVEWVSKHRLGLSDTPFCTSTEARKVCCSLDLDHDANTGFLITMLHSFGVYGINIEDGGPASRRRDVEWWNLRAGHARPGMKRAWSGYNERGEHINYTLSRAIIAASEVRE